MNFKPDCYYYIYWEKIENTLILKYLSDGRFLCLYDSMSKERENWENSIIKILRNVYLTTTAKVGSRLRLDELRIIEFTDLEDAVSYAVRNIL